MVSYEVKFKDDPTMQNTLESNIAKNYQYNAFNDFYLNLQKSKNLFYDVIIIY